MSLRPDSLLPFALAALLAGCIGSGGRYGAPDSKAPAPFTPGEIREGNPAGTELVYRVDSHGAPTVLRRTRFVEADEDGALVESSVTSLHGEPMGSTKRGYSTWEQFRDHAAYPAERTERSEETVQIEAGRYDCWRYVVDEGHAADGMAVETRVWFAHSMPGPPILMETDRNGVRVYRMELIELRRP